MIVKLSYPCVRVQQDEGAKALLLFSAPATDINDWVGIPQRLSLDGEETAGFQRTVSPRREKALQEFFLDQRNVIQNPLLCAIRNAPGQRVTFEPAEENAETGHVHIELDSFDTMSLAELFALVRAYLEERSPVLKTREIPVDLISDLQQSYRPTPGGVEGEPEGVEQEGDEVDLAENSDGEDADAGVAEEALFDESQISEFWDNVRAREELARKLPPQDQQELGFSREVLVSYLRPIILVDGQHRLRGAILAASALVEQDPVAQELVLAGATALEARSKLMPKYSRELPISLLMDESPAEHVFQYVLVNQKATPVPRALLGTIISTSLASDELTAIADRLEGAKIPLQGSRIISLLARASDSPFLNKVAKGLEGDGAEKLPWSVLGSLSDTFRYLDGARLYHESTDHAKRWKERQLDESLVVSEWQAREFASAYAYWQSMDGPWLPVFKAFWTEVVKILGETDNPDAPNYWGAPRSSNLFNKPSLHILQADFFAFLKEKRLQLTSVDQIPEVVVDWLEYVNPKYFARDWKLSGVKKDSVGTRRQWSKLWADHREGGPLPGPGEFSKLLKS